MKNILLALSFVVLFCGQVQAEKHYYTGISNTAAAARFTTATFRMDATPANCTSSSSCFAIAWASLIRPGYAQYVEAGIGYQPGKCPTSATVKLWYATQSIPGASTVGCVALGTQIKITIQKTDGQQYALVTWEYPGASLSRLVPLGGWVSGPGIHPTKFEVYSRYDSVIPKPVKLTAGYIQLQPEDTAAYFQETAPYWLVPGGVFPYFFQIDYK